MRPVVLLVLAAGCVGLAACGGQTGSQSGQGAGGRPTATAGCPAGSPDAQLKPPAPAGAGPGDPASTEVVCRWSSALRRDDVARASELFALPALVENGQAARLTTRAQVHAFNASLPCGAIVLRSLQISRYTVVTFRLVQRPGGSCGSGVGQTASTAFLIRAGKILQWLRAPDDLSRLGHGAPTAPPAPSAAGPVV